MRASTSVWWLACCCALGCGSAVRPGLANAPQLGGNSPETRVHDAIANDRDACERSTFPPGEVLRGAISPCHEEATAPAPVSIPGPATFGQSVSVPSPFGVCATGLRPRIFGAERSLTAYSLAEGRWWLSCDLPSTLTPMLELPRPAMDD
jgi:hypothetical protein